MGILAKCFHLGVRGAVRVALDRDALQPGDALAGTVSLNIAKPIDAAKLKVCVRGRQTLTWTTSSGDAMITHTKKVDHLMEEIELVSAETAFAVGVSQYPFVFVLPLDLQHNFEYKCKRIEELQGVGVSVQYEVEATLSVKDGIVSDLSSKTSFRVDALPMAVPFGRCVGAAREDTVKFLAMFKRGSCHIGLRITTDVFDAASTIEACVRLQLNTTQMLKSKARHKAHLHSTLQLPIASHTLDKALILNPTMRSLFVNVSYRVAVEVKFPMAPRIRVHAPVTVIPQLVAPRELEVLAVEDAVIVTS